MRVLLPIAAVLAVMLACAESSRPDSPSAQPASLAVTLVRASVVSLDGGIRSWIFDFTIENTGPSALDLRYFVHAETPTGDVAHRGVFPLRARRALTERVKRIDFGSRIDANLVSTGAELKLEPGEARTEEGGIILRSNQGIGYSDVVLFVYNTSGLRVGQYPL